MPRTRLTARQLLQALADGQPVSGSDTADPAVWAEAERLEDPTTPDVFGFGGFGGCDDRVPARRASMRWSSRRGNRSATRSRVGGDR